MDGLDIQRQAPVSSLIIEEDEDADLLRIISVLRNRLFTQVTAFGGEKLYVIPLAMLEEVLSLPNVRRYFRNVFTHRSFKQKDSSQSYEFLETHGDNVVNRFVSEIIFKNYEGRITNDEQNKMLAHYKSNMEFGKFMREAIPEIDHLIRRSEKMTVLQPKIYADVFEALAGAVELCCDHVMKGMGGPCAKNVLIVLTMKDGQMFVPEIKYGAGNAKSQVIEIFGRDSVKEFPGKGQDYKFFLQVTITDEARLKLLRSFPGLERKLKDLTGRSGANDAYTQMTKQISISLRKLGERSDVNRGYRDVITQISENLRKLSGRTAGTIANENLLKWVDDTLRGFASKQVINPATENLLKEISGILLGAQNQQHLDQANSLLLDLQQRFGANLMYEPAFEGVIASAKTLAEKIGQNYVQPTFQILEGFSNEVLLSQINEAMKAAASALPKTKTPAYELLLNPIEESVTGFPDKDTAQNSVYNRLIVMLATPEINITTVTVRENDMIQTIARLRTPGLTDRILTYNKENMEKLSFVKHESAEEGMVDWDLIAESTNPKDMVDGRGTRRFVTSTTVSKNTENWHTAKDNLLIEYVRINANR